MGPRQRGLCQWHRECPASACPTVGWPPARGVDAETTESLGGEVCEPLPTRLGQGRKIEHEYVCNGVDQISLEVEPRNVRRDLAVAARHTPKDWARFIRGMLEECYGEAEHVILVLDNLNTHAFESLYKTYRPELALAERLGIHYTPNHGSWLNIAEFELSALCGKCFNRRTPDLDTMRRKIEVWKRDWNNRHTEVDWQFKTSDARVRLRISYPKL